jgi:hypothetical protein
MSPWAAAARGPPWIVTVVVHDLMYPVHEISNMRKNQNPVKSLEDCTEAPVFEL